jgi:mannose-6-phosphate isomerase-like protein (cupin superfamily)
VIEHISHEGVLLAIILRAAYARDGIEFFTPPEYSQQLGYMNRPPGHVIAPHTHKEVLREVRLTKEVLFFRSGRARADFYDDRQRYVESRILAAGDVLFLAAGGHGFEMLERTEIIEVKQGPYAGDGDKTPFAPAAREELRIAE